MLPITSSRRISKELKDFKCAKDIAQLIQVEPIGDDLFHWKGYIMVKNDCPFMNGKYLIDIQFPQTYPFAPPNITFITKMYHPNISENGLIDLDMLKHDWSPALTITKALLTVSCVLHEPIRINKQWEYINNECVKLYNESRLLYESTANEYAVQYANATKQCSLKDVYIAIKHCLSIGFGQHVSFILEPIIVEYIGFNIRKLNKWCKELKLDTNQRYKQLIHNQITSEQIYLTYTEQNFNQHLINVQCVTITGEIINISIWNDSVVKVLRHEIHDKEGTPMEQIVVVFNGKAMNDHKTLHDYKLYHNAIVHMILRYE
eukprot:160015_1